MNTPRTDKMMLDDMVRHRKLLKQNAPIIFEKVQARNPINLETGEIMNRPGDQLPSSKDHVDQEPILNTTD